MSSEIILPELAESMTSATLTTWLKQPGDSVRSGEPVAEVETDKTTVEIEAPTDGILDRIQVAAGTEDVAVGTVLAVLRDVDGEEKDTPVDDGVFRSNVSDSGQAVTMEVRLPKMAESMAVATVTTWLRQPGQVVRAGDPIAEIETDKTTVELESPAGGILDVIHVAAGTEDVPVDTVLATLRLSGDGDVVETRESGSVQDKPNSDVAAELPFKPTASEAVEATPLARQMSALAGLNLASISGTGPAGQITKADIERQLRGGAASRESTEPVSDSAHADEPLTAMRRVTAERMTMSKQTVPHFYLELSCSVEHLVAFRKRANAVSGALPITVNDLLVRASGLALAKVPQANSAWTGDAVRVFETVDVAVAVSTPSGLVTPVVRAAETKAVQTIAVELRDLATRARKGQLKPGDYTGGTCTISNLGMFGVSSLFAILNPPQSCILGFGAIEQRPVVRDQRVVVESMMTVTLSADHRAIDGETGAELLQALKELLEGPGVLFE
tara:strand:+ start:628 stop:2130 length:1503 start_codon:yes stop_codon:yes gene_type:complete